MNLQAKVISFLLLTAFLATGIFSFVHARDMAQGMHHAGDCPLVEGLQSFCSTPAIDHLLLWQQATLVGPESFLSFIGLTALLAITFHQFAWPRLKPPSPSILRSRKARIPSSFVARLLSDGILHPKIP